MDDESVDSNVDCA